MERVEKEVRLSYGRGKRGYVSVVREHYLREDIACGSRLCTLCQDTSTTGRAVILSDMSHHYVLPDAQCLTDYLDLWQHPTISDIILLQTTLSQLRVIGGRQRYRLARNLLSSSSSSSSSSTSSSSSSTSSSSSPCKRCVLFSNENHWETYSSQHPNETKTKWIQRLVYRAGVWYANHLQISGQSSTPTIVIVTSTPHEYQMIKEEGNAERLLIMTVEEYLACYLPDNSDLNNLYHSLSLSLSSSSSSSDAPGSTPTEYEEYLSMAAIKEGLIMGRLLQGRLHVSSRHPREEAEVVISGDRRESQLGEQEEGRVLVIGQTARNRAIHGDKVVIRLLPKSDKCPTGPKGDRDGERITRGVVVGVLERRRTELVASFEETGEASHGKAQRVLVIPYDIRIPKIRIGTRQADFLRSHRVLVRLDSWPTTSLYPGGHFVRSIGPIGDLETEIAVIMIEHGLLCPPFSHDLLSELPEEESWEVVDEEVKKKRRDLRRTHLIFSIDPQGCEDVDDALSIRQLKKGIIELGVHIADVSHFVKPGSLTDLEARSRSTSVYLADRRYDMLPSVLSAHLCSLLSGVDRYAVSVIWQLDKDYQVKNVWYGRTIIRSKYKLTYEVAQQLCDGAAASEVKGDIPELSNLDLSQDVLNQRVEELREAVQQLSDIAGFLKQQRRENGAVNLDSAEVKVEINEAKSPEDITPHQHLDVHDTIAECMIFANHWVAKRIHTSLPTSSLLRRHPPPSQSRFSHLRTCAGVRGFEITTATNRELADSLDRAVDPCNPSVNKMLRILATQAMSQAEYFSTGSVSPYHSNQSQFHSSGSQFHHYGLALDYYTHFTSPIRRYADLLVHRQLLSVVERETKEEEEVCHQMEGLPSNKQLEEYSKHMNEKHRAAQLAQIASTELFQAFYFSNHETEDERCICVGVVYAILSRGVRVHIPRYGVKGIVYLEDKAGLVVQPSNTTDMESIIFSSGDLRAEETGVTVTHPRGHYSISLLDHIRVRVAVETSHAHGPSIKLSLVTCGPVPLEEQKLSLPASSHRTTEVVAGVKHDLQSQTSSSSSSTTSTSSSSSSYSQTQSSLYTLVQRLRSLSLQED